MKQYAELFDPQLVRIFNCVGKPQALARFWNTDFELVEPLLLFDYSWMIYASLCSLGYKLDRKYERWLEKTRRFQTYKTSSCSCQNHFPVCSTNDDCVDTGLQKRSK
ncbi:unnamed protein product [Albugo candida]|uniref:Uncharacterized protein n=1 Tax=Albugo candida TaxID=65357 RepID=A0A024FTT3_9STRA|nr:unnamed protein product [Albugo candida]|eukprot:CCI10069.1 unnamed protein product [Albugo candida]